jgi:hypothetical protein
MRTEFLTVVTSVAKSSECYKEGLWIRANQWEWYKMKSCGNRMDSCSLKKLQCTGKSAAIGTSLNVPNSSAVNTERAGYSEISLNIYHARVRQ